VFLGQDIVENIHKSRLSSALDTIQSDDEWSLGVLLLMCGEMVQDEGDYVRGFVVDDCGRGGRHGWMSGRPLAIMRRPRAKAGVERSSLSCTRCGVKLGCPALQLPR
jgi:hypothetical protein